MKRAMAFLLLAAVAFTARADEWKLVWQDEFDEPGLPSSVRWGYETGFVRNGEKQFYTKARKENVRIEDGRLIIEARKEPWPTGRPTEKVSRKRAGGREGHADYTSASLTTQGKAAWTYGRIEVRARLPKGRGTWPAIWMLGTNIGAVGWPACGEIDIMEFVGYDPGVVHANVHTKKYNHMLKTGRGASLKLPDASEAFHVYAVEWSRERMDFSVDGKTFFRCKNDGQGPDAWPFDADQYLILNLAVGGGWGGQKGIDDAIFPVRYEIDYVRVYQKPGTR
jgi:beta-glucanase (GH16 family)